MILTALDVELVGTPPGMRDGDYLFLVPTPGGYAPERVRIEVVGGEARIVYEPPVVRASEMVGLDRAQIVELFVRRTVERWRGLEGEELAAEVERTRAYLLLQTEALAHAPREGIALSFDPDPEALLAELDGLDPEAAREVVVGRLTR